MNTKRHENLLYKELSYQIQGAAIEVRRNFGPSHKESIYQNAFAEELKSRGINFEKEKGIKIYSPKTKKIIGSYKPDFIVEGQIIVELKAVEKIPRLFLNQLYSYLRNSEYELGYFINFASPKLYMKRVIFTNDRKFLRLKNLLVMLSFILVVFSVLPINVKAAELNLIFQPRDIGLNQQFQVDLLLNTENEEINALEGRIIFPQELLELKEIREGNSIINFWVEKPRLEAGNQVIFSGITPGGYKGKEGLIFSLVFSSMKEGSGVFEFRDIRVLKNDGAGTPAKVKISNSEFLISNQLSVTQLPIAQIEDHAPPDVFTPEVARDPNIFDGKWFLVFAAQDKGAGIDRYEVKEEKEFKIWKFELKKGKWLAAESPYLLRDQKLQSYIYVKALDKAGNERVAVLAPQNLPRWYENYFIWAIIILALLFCFIAFKKFLWAKQNTKRHQ